MRAKPFTSYIPGLDGLRAAAVMIVLISHIPGVHYVPGRYGVTVFFFLSGFLITTLLLMEWRKSGKIDIPAFYKRRAIRILPPMYLALGIAILLGLLIGTHMEPMRLASVLIPFGNFSNYSIALSGNENGFPPGMVLLWSLAVEEHLYLLYPPILYWGLRKVGPEKVVRWLIVVCGLVLVWRCFLVYGHYTFMVTDARIDSILWGAVLAFWRNPALDPEAARPLANPWLVALCCIVTVVSVSLHNAENLHTWPYTLQGLCLIPIFSAAMLFSRKGFFQFLEWKPIQWTGKVSYTLYLCHWMILTAAFALLRLPAPATAAIAIALAIGYSAASYELMEKKLARLRKKMHEQTAHISATADPELESA